MFNFGGLEDHFDPDTSQFIVMSVPYDLTTSYVPGARNGPKAIIEASTHMELYDEELGLSPYKAGIHTLTPLEVVTYGPKAMTDVVYETAKSLIATGKTLVTLGGEHSITVGPVRAFKEKYPGLSVVQFDAHTDLRDEFEGASYNHACVMHRIFDLNIPFVQIGIRSLCEDEAYFIENNHLKPYYQHNLPEPQVLVEAIVKKLSGPLYITFDLDCLDPAIMPATGTPEPGGMDYRSALTILAGLFAHFQVVGFDVVELSPIPGLVAPDFLAARLVYKMMAFKYVSKSI